jgi:pepF/M3 family oligoendopeptidase
MFDDPDRETRKAAFDLFEKTWTGIAKPCAAALNNQAGFRLALYRHRGWDDVLREPLMENRMTPESLEAMWSVVDAKGGKLLDYFAAKARLLGVDRLSWFDIHAPMGRDDREFTFSEAVDFTVENLRKANPAMAEFSRMAIDRRWVEAENRPGKRAGGFCTGFPKSKESRIFMTFTGSLNSLMTLAHELGHAYHSWVMRDLPAGARRYPMSVAETASTFSETIVRNAAYRSAAGEEERLRVLAAKLDDAVSFLMDIRSRFAFETAFFRERRTRSMSVADLNALMEEAQHDAFKNALERYHPLFWASKLHFYITAAPFYNFPYTFGFLFSSGVYARVEDEGPAFQEAYIALLRDTGRMTTDELARKHLGIDLRTPDFWETAADRVLDDVDEFTILANRIAGDPK